MEEQKKNYRLIIGVIITIIVVCIVAIIGYWFMRPYLRAKSRVETLKSEDYEFSLNYSISGIELLFGNDLLEGTIEGKKSDDVLYGSVLKDGEEYVQIYADGEGECLFNIKPVFDILLNSIQKIDWLTAAIPDTYVSLEQIQSITGEPNVQKIENAEVSSFAFSNSIKKTQRPVEAVGSYLSNADFFRVEVDEDIVLIIGIPEEDGKLYLQTEKDGVKLVVNAEYTVKSIDTIEMPDESISDDVFDVFKKIYLLWEQNNK